MTLYKGDKVIAGSRSYIGNIGDIKYTTRVDLPFGGSWCDGSIKLKAQFPTVYQMLIDGKLQALDIATYESALNLNGSCGFFGLDTATESFRVPSLNDVYIKSGQVADEFGAESLPNIKGKLQSEVNFVKSDGFDGPFSFNETYNYSIGVQNSATYDLKRELLFDASRVSPTYQDGAKVNPDHVKYRAYVVLYTGADTNIDITKEIQLNNPFSFGMSQWFESDPKNASWLKSDGAFHSGAIYESFYNWLVSEYNNPDMLPKKVNAYIVGNPTISNGVVGGFSANNYLKLPEVFVPNSNSWEIALRITTGVVDVRQKIFAHINGVDFRTPTINIEATGQISLNVSVNGSSWLINVSSNSTEYLLKANTEYDIIAQFTGSAYVLKVKQVSEEEYTTVLNHSSSVAFYQERLAVPTIGFENYGGGTYLFNGSVDLSKSYIKINDSLWWKGFANSVYKDTERYTNYDYVINTESRTFKLPLKTRTASGNAVVGNDMTLGLTDNTENFGLVSLGQQWSATYQQSNYGTATGSNAPTNEAYVSNKSVGITTDPQYSGIETSSNGLKLYFYVGETVQDANLINASKVLDLLAKLESYDYVVESKTPTADDQRWYRIYKSGWIEQGGNNFGQSVPNRVDVTFLKPFANINYIITLGELQDYQGTGSWPVGISSKSVSGFTHQGAGNGSTRQNSFHWYACGQGA